MTKNCDTRISIINVKNGIFMRGMLVDLPRLKGVPYLTPVTPIYAQDIEAWEKVAGVKVSAGDAVFIGPAAGRDARPRPVRYEPYGQAIGTERLDDSVVETARCRAARRRCSAELAPSDAEGETGAVHDFALVYLGVHIFDNFDLEALAEAAQARKRWDFLLTVAPLAIRGGTGSPVNPIATF